MTNRECRWMNAAFLLRGVALVAGPLSLVLALTFLSPPTRVKAQPTNLGPNVYALTIGTVASMAAVGANPTRRALSICNGHATQTVTFTFGTAITPVSLTTGLVLAAGNVVASCYNTPGSVLSGLGAQLNFIASGATTPVTVFEY